MSELAKLKCIPCQGGVPALPAEEVEKLMPKIHADWTLTQGGTRLRRELKFKDFAAAMELATQIGSMADEQWHHPELHLGYGHMEIEIWTHKINGLVESDFIFCAKADELIAKAPTA